MSQVSPFVIGEVLFDCFPDGRRVLGGAPFNVAWHLAGFGSKPLFLSAVGEDDAAEEILERMRAHGMPTTGMQRLSGVETGRVDVKNAETEPAYDFPEVSAWDCFELDDCEVAATPSILYQGSLFLRAEQSRKSSYALAERVDCPRFVDVNLREPWYEPERIRRLVEGAHCLKVSEEELGLVARWFELSPNDDLSALARQLMERASVAHVFITLGADGAIWVTEAGEVHRADVAEVDEFVDSVGAGDASASVALLGLAKEWPVPVILERAMQFAARICGLPGAIPQQSELYDEVSRKWNKP